MTPHANRGRRALAVSGLALTAVLTGCTPSEDTTPAPTSSDTVRDHSGAGIQLPYLVDPYNGLTTVHLVNNDRRVYGAILLVSQGGSFLDISRRTPQFTNNMKLDIAISGVSQTQSQYLGNQPYAVLPERVNTHWPPSGFGDESIRFNAPVTLDARYVNAAATAQRTTDLSLRFLVHSDGGTLASDPVPLRVLPGLPQATQQPTRGLGD